MHMLWVVGVVVSADQCSDSNSSVAIVHIIAGHSSFIVL